MLLKSSAAFKHLSSVRHEGKVVVFGVTAPDPANNEKDLRILYTVRRDGFEERLSSSAAQSEDWENWRFLDLPGPLNKIDTSVTAQETKTLSIPSKTGEAAWIEEARKIGNGTALFYRSIFDSSALHTDAPVQVLSVLGHLYVFRAAKNGSLLVDRFVLDGLTNVLVRKLEVRFKRSGKRFEPLQPQQGSDLVDAPDFRDIDGKPFYEPTVELTLVNRIVGGRFAVVLAPTLLPSENMWHFFAATSSAHIESVSFRASEEGLFDVGDKGGEPGIVRRTVTIDNLGAAGSGVGSIAATRYDTQVERKTKDGKTEVFRDKAFVMLAVNSAGTTRGVATISFVITGDGHLARITAAPATEATLRADTTNVILRPSELQDVKPDTGGLLFPTGPISRLNRSADGATELALEGAEAASLPAEGMIRIRGGGAYNGAFDAQPVRLGAIAAALATGAQTLVLDTPLAAPIPVGARLTIQRAPAVIVPPFDVVLAAAAATGSRELRIQPSSSTAAVGVTVAFPDGIAVDTDAGEALGKWEALEAPRADGRQPLGEIAAVARAASGIRLDVPQHQVAAGTRIELAGATDLEGVYSYTRVDGNRIRLKRKWDPGTLLPAPERVRNGLLFEKPGDGIELSGVEALNFTEALTFEVWVQTTSNGFLLSRFTPGQAWGPDSKGIAIVDGRAAFIAGSQVRRGNTNVADGRFHHVAAVLRKVDGALVCDLVVDGVLQTLPSVPLVADDAKQRVQLGMAAAPPSGLPAQVTAGFSGTLFDARLWEKTLPRTVIAANRDADITGQEEGLAGSWRLSAVVEDDPPRVADFSPRRRDGIVRGGPIAGQTILRRTPVGGKAVVGFSNHDFFAAVEGGTYEESFEFQLDVAEAAPFRFRCQGKRDLDSTELIDIEAGNPSFAVARPGEPWILARCTFTVPEGVSLVRAFGISDLTGAWNAITVRRHRITELSQSVREHTAAESVQLTSLALQDADTTSADMARLELTDAGLTRHAQLLELFDRKIQRLATMYAHPANYWCQIGVFADSVTTEVVSFDSGAPTVVGIPEEPAAGTLFRFPRLIATGEGLEVDPQLQLGIPVQRCAVVSAISSSKEAAKTASGLDVNVAECPPLCLEADDGRVVRRSVLLDSAGFAANLRSDLRKEFETDTGASPSPMRKGLTSLQKWEIQGLEVDTSTVVSVEGGSITDQSAEFPVTFNFDPSGDAGSAELLAVGAGNSLTLTKGGSRFTLLRPKIDLSEPVKGKEKKAGRPVDEVVRQGVLRVRDQLTDALRLARPFQLFPVSGRDALTQQIADKRKEVADALTTARGNYLSKAGSPAGAKQERLSPSGAPRVSGAFLSASGISSAARLNLLETSSGQVEISFAENDPVAVSDHAGTTKTIERTRLRQLSMDTGAEMWQADFLPVCLKLDTARLAVKGLTVGPEWTAEFWFFSPLAASNNEYRFLEFADLAVSAINIDNDILLGFKKLGQFAGPPIVDNTSDLAVNVEAGWHHMAVSARPGRTRFYLDGALKGDIAASVSGRILSIGNNAESGAGVGRMADVRIWNTALSEEEIAVNSFVRPSGNEPGLIAWFPLNGDTSNGAVQSSAEATLMRGKTEVTVMPVEPFPRQDFLRNIEGAANLVTGEYTTFGTDPESGKLTSMMRRFYAWPAKGGIELHGQKRVEELELVWVSNAQFAPTLLGYIEGAPPVPSENLTVDPESYGGATSVALNQSTQVDYSWTRSKEVSQGANLSLFLGIDVEQSVGVGIMARSATARSGVTGGLSFAQAMEAESSVSASSVISTSDSLKLAGTVETEPRFPRLGRRFVPKNIGYALVISSLADVYVTRLKKSRRMMDYTVLPVPNLPPQINTITFLINPGYVMNGTLDGLIGTSAADDLFYRHTPEMRSRRGSLHPGSYLRLLEADALKSKIEKQDKERESYFYNFDATLALTFTSQDEEVERRINQGDAPTVIGVELTEAKGLKQPDAATSDAKLDQLDTKLDVVKDDYRSQQSEAKAQALKKNEEIAGLISDPDKQQHALKSFQAWQKKLETLLARAGKRNIVNTYVWDADGGLRAETQQFASTVEHTIGSSVNVDASAGIELEVGILAPKVELSAAYQFSMTQTLSKNVATSHAMSLEVDMDGIESAGITGPNDEPLMPGEKVDRFRFSTFYLEGSTANFNDFFNYVVDPRWLASNDEEARALRQVQSGKANRSWRVLHRVTAIERPALMGFGRDVRAQRPAAAAETIEDAVRGLREENRELKEKVDQILALFQKAQAAGV
jgi:hypothetical protein